MTTAIVTSHNRPRPSRLPVIALVASGALIVAGLAVYWRGWANHVAIGYGADLPALLSTELFAASATIVGAIIARRRRDVVIAWLLILLGLASSAMVLGLYANAVTASTAEGTGTGVRPTLELHGWLASTLLQPAMGALTGLLMFTFPDGRLPSRAWRPAVALLFVGVVARFVEVGLMSDRAVYLPTLDNPFSLVGHAAGAGTTLGRFEPGLVALLLGMALAAASLVARYRKAADDVRRPIRAFALVGAAVVATLVPLWHLFVFVDPLEGRGQDLWVAFFLTASLFPVVVGFAITRSRLYGLDRIVSRTFVYGMTTAIVAGLFTASIGMSQRLFVAFTGETSDMAIVLTTLIAASAYTPVRRRLEALAERLFKYEEPRLGSYGQSLRDMLSALDPEEAARRLLGEAVSRLHACEGWVELDDGSYDISMPAADGSTAGTPEDRCPPVVAVPIEGRGGRLGRLFLGPRLDGSPYRPEDILVLEEAARLLARAIELPAGGSRAARPDPVRGTGEPWPIVQTGEPMAAGGRA